MENFEIFHRTWWKRNKNWPDGLEPWVGKSRHIGFAETETEARQMCEEWNEKYKTAEQIELSDKAEFQRT